MFDVDESNSMDFAEYMQVGSAEDKDKQDLWFFKVQLLSYIQFL